MSEDLVKFNGTISNYKLDSEAVTIPFPVRAVVKDNIDTTHSGKIKVYIENYGGIDPNDAKNWVTVKYMSPWFGLISENYDVLKNPDKIGYGTFESNPHSYGFWASAPDIGSEVVCIFLNGKIGDGYYIGGIPMPGLHHMVPAIGSGTNVVPNAAEAKSYGGADRLPVTEVNYTNIGIRISPEIYREPKPIHSYQAYILYKQGLIRDNLRGVISSSSQRETPSKVFGFSTPGGAIYKGGYDNKTIKSGISSGDKTKAQIIGRVGGHSIVMDDGTIDGKDQLMRLRTSGGHMIMMNDTGQNLFIIHSNGQSWVELGKEGTVDIFAANSFNVRTQGDINFHADRDINLHAKRNLKMHGGVVAMEADGDIVQRTGGNFTGDYTMNYNIRANLNMSFTSMGPMGINSTSPVFVTGSLINLNSGTAPSIPAIVPELTKIVHMDTVYSDTVGWINSPTGGGGKDLESIATRVPTHQPWAGANSGVNIKIEQE